MLTGCGSVLHLYYHSGSRCRLKVLRYGFIHPCSWRKGGGSERHVQGAANCWLRPSCFLIVCHRYHPFDTKSEAVIFCVCVCYGHLHTFPARSGRLIVTRIWQFDAHTHTQPPVTRTRLFLNPSFLGLSDLTIFKRRQRLLPLISH
ncbi:hypothetical protein, unlikely [Trypanosoma brucei gambiense DAL972]|uniref:Uncharacterized protein n=1 Tax=Trypanosoma brucei gambiense (strain MHOM/CI/86/DAL972) TaxID=679716 RepID=D0A3K5_TRYB9|nr:hypothetical protein, unlikely [Trypanosoma brucei gambiense DAL972]CBH15849.1 hypothetical protein, unlikely [Trypanosoma brucei gambiense DAL972]|eukprot:XP_011778113.1 hypothetical protein, unlikely [Trypanosoma brucei gambiense DAL972]